MVQPNYDLKNKSFRLAEALLRLDHPSLKDVSLIEFIPLAEDSGITVLAEGIETEEQYDIVKDMQVDYIQGYLFAKPMSIADTIEFFLKHKV